MMVNFTRKVSKLDLLCKIGMYLLGYLFHPTPLQFVYVAYYSGPAPIGTYLHRGGA